MAGRRPYSHGYTGQENPYRLAVPMSRLMKDAIDGFAEEWQITRTEAAYRLLQWATEQHPGVASEEWLPTLLDRG